MNEHLEPESHDCFFTSSGPLGSRTSVSINEKFIGEYSSQDDAEEAARCWIEDNNFYPNCWIVSDHGNYHLTTIGA